MYSGKKYRVFVVTNLSDMCLTPIRSDRQYVYSLQSCNHNLLFSVNSREQSWRKYKGVVSYKVMNCWVEMMLKMDFRKKKWVILNCGILSITRIPRRESLLFTIPLSFMRSNDDPFFPLFKLRIN